MSNQIAATAEEQGLVATEVSKSIQNINDQARRSREMSEQSDQYCQGLVSMSHALLDKVNMFETR